MKKLILGLAIGSCGLMSTQIALADGYARPVSIKDVGARCASFHGLYFGANVGAGYLDHTWSDRDAWAKNEVDPALPSSVNGTENGWLGGIQGGFNWQKGCTLFGFEADWSWTNLEQTNIHTDGQPGLALDRLRVTRDVNSFGTLRTRTGVVVDSLLLFATGGLAWAKMDSSWAVTDFRGGSFVTETFGTSDTRWGWTAGVGTEWALAPNISIKSEALYLKFTDNDSAFNSAFAVQNGSPAIKRFDEQDAMWVARIGVNYRFGCGSAC
ncbi:MAG TPA: outer membrane beta-barrel protein [Hyphomicrobiaceae bacterium]